MQRQEAKRTGRPRCSAMDVFGQPYTFGAPLPVQR